MPSLLAHIEARINADLTDEQRLAVNARGKSVVIACPGSGKTKLVAYRLARHIADPTQQNKGIAILSFTNNAVEEISYQLTTLGIEVPLPNQHFLGTIDSFIYQHIFRPHGDRVMGCVSAPEIVPASQKSILDKYRPVGASEIYVMRNGKKEHRTIHLAEFKFNHRGALNFSDVLENAIYGAKEKFPKEEVEKAKLKYAADGLASHSDALYWSYKLVCSPKYHWLAKSIATKYSSWILDEAQDTSLLHILMLDQIWKIRESEILVVGDPDQAIFEWHEAVPTYLPHLAAKDTWQRFSLTRNKRSSQLICDASNNFRNLSLSPTPIVADGKFSRLTTRPLILTFGIGQYDKLPNALKQIWLSRIGDNIPPPFLAIVAWSNETVRLIRGGQAGSIHATELGRLIFTLLRHAHSWEERKAYQTLECIVSQLYVDRPSFGANYEYLPDRTSETDWLKLRAKLFERIVRLDTALSLGEILAKSRKILEEFLTAPPFSMTLKLGSRIKTTAGADLTPIAQLFGLLSKDDVIVETVHRMKGFTVDGIMLVGGYDPLTRSSDVSEWLKAPRPDGLCSEPRRIAYVAMTRPQKLLVVAIPRECAKPLVEHRDWKEGGFDLVDINDVL